MKSTGAIFSSKGTGTKSGTIFDVKSTGIKARLFPRTIRYHE
jgi:hypothetical protein